MRRSIRIRRAPCSLAGSACRGCRTLSMGGTTRTQVVANLGVATRKLDRWTRPCFCLRHPKVPAWRQDPSQTLNALTRRFNSMLWASFSPLFGAPVAPVSRQTSPRSVPRLAGRALVWNPSGSVRRDPKLNSRRPERTLGQTRPARQGLVRVPESNTKYGGK